MFFIYKIKNFLEFDKGQILQNSGSTYFFLKAKDECAIVWLTNKPALKREVVEKKNELDLTDSKSSENSFCEHYRKSSTLKPKNANRDPDEIKGKKPQKRKSIFLKVFCSFACFN